MIYILMILIIAVLAVAWMWFCTKVTLYIYVTYMIEQHYRFPNQDEMTRLRNFVITNMLDDLFHRNQMPS